MPKKNTTTKDPAKSVDLPPYGSRNPDPITNAAGSHPIETGVGAVLGGAASGLALGMVGGPVGAVIGAIVGGAAAGGLAGKGVGELIDPTTEDNWIREYYDSRDDHKKGRKPEDYRPAYQYGLEARSRHDGKSFHEVEKDLRTGWEKSRGDSRLSWDEARGAASHAFDRTIDLHEEQLRVNKTSVDTGDVKVRKEVHTDRKTISVPVEREEIVIERRPASGRAASGDIRAEEIRIPTKEERVHVTKETVVKEEVSIGKRKVRDTETVSEDIRSEEVVVESSGKAKVRNTGSGSRK